MLPPVPADEVDEPTRLVRAEMLRLKGDLERVLSAPPRGGTYRRELVVCVLARHVWMSFFVFCIFVGFVFFVCRTRIELSLYIFVACFVVFPCFLFSIARTISRPTAVRVALRLIVRPRITKKQFST